MDRTKLSIKVLGKNMALTKYHYTYCVTEIATNRMYIGARSSKVQPIDDIGVKYFTSSFDKDFRHNFKSKPELYKCEILGVYANRKDAILNEIKLHNKNCVATNTNFINRVKQTSVGYDSTGTISVRSENESCYKKIPTSEYDPSIHTLPWGCQTGKHNSGALKINIYNNKDELVEKCHGNLVKVCKKNEFPFRALYESLEQHKRILGNRSKSRGFTNWCAVIEGEQLPAIRKPRYTIINEKGEEVAKIINLHEYARTLGVNSSMFFHSLERGRKIAGQSQNTLKFKGWRVIRNVE